MNNSKAKLIEYISANPIAVVSTTNDKSVPHAAAVYVCVDEDCHVYFTTKKDTRKFDNLVANPSVALTIVRPADNSTLQAEGKASIVKDNEVISNVFKKLAKIYAHGPDWQPPIAKLKEGPYEIIGIELKKARLANFKGKAAGSASVFTEFKM